MINKIRLRFVSVSEIVGTNDLALMILADEQYERQISIVCSRPMALQLDIRNNKLPIANRMLPEVLSRIIAEQTDLRFYMFINNVSDGQYEAMIVNADTFETMPIRVSDAVLLSIAGNIPLYIDEQLMMRQSVPYLKPSNNEMRVPLPMNTMSVEMLDKAIERAISEENYEQASLLTEERKRRNTTLDN